MPWPYFCSQSGLEALWHFQRMWIGKMTASTAHYCMGHASVGRNESDSGAQSRSQAPCKGFIGTCFPHKYFYYQYFTYYLRLSHIFLVFLSHFFLVGPQAGPAGPTSTGFPGVPADRPSASTAGRAPWQPARLCFIADTDGRSGASSAAGVTAHRASAFSFDGCNPRGETTPLQASSRRVRRASGETP